LSGSEIPAGALNGEPATVTLTIPCMAEYVSVARLAILGVASRMPFSYDEVEDVRLAVGETCTHAVERSKAVHDSLAQSGDTGGNCAPEKGQQITIVSSVSDTALTIEVTDNVPALQSGAERKGGDDFDDPEIDHQGLGALLIEILVDEVEIRSGDRGTTVRLVKLAPTA